MRHEARFWEKVTKGPDCWEWSAARVGGYGRFQLDGRWQRAHRVAYELTKEQVTEIRQRYAAGGVTQETLGAEFGVTRSLIGQIVRLDIWAHI